MSSAVSVSIAECVFEAKATVGESPVWCASERCLYWVDITGRLIHRFDVETSWGTSFELPEIVTAIALRQSGGLIVLLKKSIAYFDPRSSRLETAASVELDRPQNRFNDGKCDPQGRFWAGTMDAVQWEQPAGALYRFDGEERIEKMQSNVICSNGTGWSPDGRTMYYTESFRYSIFAFDFDAETGSLANRRVFANIDRSVGFPDGLTVDRDGFVWSCIVGAGRIFRYDQDGRVCDEIRLPVSRATSCAFGGDELQTLYITSARETLDPATLKREPLAGSLFAAKLPVGGFEPAEFAG